MSNKNIDIKEKFTLATQKHRNNNLTEAIKLYQEVLETNPNHFESNFYLGTLYAQNSNFIKSESNYYYIKYDDFISLEIYLSENALDSVSIVYSDYEIRLLNIKVTAFDTLYSKKYFNLENDSSSIFDMRVK